MKANLAYIDEHVDRMLEEEVKKPTVHAADFEKATKPRIIAGFEVKDPNQERRLLEEGREKRRAVVRAYREEKSQLMDLIGQTGAKPLAVLPTTMFNLICKQSGLYYVPKNLRSEVNPTHFMTWLRTPEGVKVDSNAWTGRQPLTVGRMKVVKEKTAETYLEEFGRETVMRHLLTLEGTHFETEDEEVERLIQVARWAGSPVRVFDTDGISSGQVGMTFFPGRPQASRTDGRKYGLILPNPPEDVIDTLIRIADLDPQTVCVYGAVDFLEGGVVSVLKQARNDYEEREKRVAERVDWRLHDPIVYVTRGKVTAVMAQFGPFPVEQAIVDRITAAEFLPQA